MNSAEQDPCGKTESVARATLLFPRHDVTLTRSPANTFHCLSRAPSLSLPGPSRPPAASPSSRSGRRLLGEGPALVSALFIVCQPPVNNAHSRCAPPCCDLRQLLAEGGKKKKKEEREVKRERERERERERARERDSEKETLSQAVKPAHHQPARSLRLGPPSPLREQWPARACPGRPRTGSGSRAPWCPPPGRRRRCTGASRASAPCAPGGTARPRRS